MYCYQLISFSLMDSTDTYRPMENGYSCDRHFCQGDQWLHITWYNDVDFRRPRPTDTAFCQSEMLWHETRTTALMVTVHPRLHTLLFLHLLYSESILYSRTIVSWHWLGSIHTPYNINTKHKVIQISVANKIQSAQMPSNYDNHCIVRCLLQLESSSYLQNQTKGDPFCSTLGNVWCGQ